MGGAEDDRCVTAALRPAAAPGRPSAAPRTVAVPGTGAAAYAGPPAAPATARSSAAADSAGRPLHEQGMLAQERVRDQT